MKSRDGFTLIELMIASAVLCLLMVSFITYMYQQAHHGANLQDSRSNVQLQNGLQSTIRNSDTIIATDDAQIDPTLSPDPASNPFSPNNTAE